MTSWKSLQMNKTEIAENMKDDLFRDSQKNMKRIKEEIKEEVEA